MSAPTAWERASSLTISEAAPVLTDLLGRPVSRSLAYEWAHAGRFPTRRDTQGHHRVTPADLRAFARAERPKPPGWDQPALDLP